MNKKIILLLVCALYLTHLNSTELIEGNAGAAPGTTFSFSINKNVISQTGNFYIGALENIANNQQYALSRLTRETAKFTALVGETATVDGVQNTTNPIFGAGIIALDLFEVEDGFFTRDIPLVVTQNKQACVNMLENITNPENVTIVTSNDLHDAQGNVSNGIVSMKTNIVSHIFAAVKPNGGEFGDPFSGIALLIKGTLNGEKVFGEINAETGRVENIHALQLDQSSPVLNIQSSTLQSILPNIVSLHWDMALQLLFIGLDVTANTTPGDGARAVVVCSLIEKSGIRFKEIAPDSAFDDNNLSNMIGVRGANEPVSIHAINSLYTSTALNYLIIVGGNGEPDTTQQSVYALPLVNTGDAKGTIAQKNAQPTNIFQDNIIPHLIGRSISQAATTQNEMPQASDPAVMVGGGDLLAGPIVNILTRDDTVFAFVGDNTNDNAPGVYSSQAIFDQSGKITSWTSWQRAAGTTNQIFGCALEEASSKFILASGSSDITVDTVERTLWSDGSATGLQPLTTILNNAFPSNNGGIQSLQTFLPQSPGLQNIATLVAGGIGNIVISQTGILNNNGIIIPTPATNDNTVIINGDVLKNIGPITALEFAANTSNGWLFVGGSNGLAILAENNGAGWNSTTALSNNLSGLTNTMQFHAIGNYQFVKKLIYDDNFLYVITHSTIDRIDLSPTNFNFNNYNPITIATSAIDSISNTGGFLDGIFSQACAIIATTNGLLRIGDNKDVRTVTNVTDAQWVPIEILENAGAPTALYAVTSTNRAQDITRAEGGFFYALTANVAINQSRINRFAVKPLSSTQAMNPDIIKPFDDLFVKNISSFLLSFGEFRSNFATDGAFYFATRNQNIDIPPIVTLTPSFPVPRVGVKKIGDLSMPVKINLNGGTEINALQRSQASGSWIIAGNFDTQVLE